ncbi:serine/threonine protein kinase [Plasmodium gonderi]|uniref:Serine/threonine protein kinase n=1 Tax=Plasmodium gonderi TaxID=77519 RepID=A0A1Y1JDS1_PLAGO|nr:serine/threonine protein kinase [Plasmodium gonderi]GAW79475.1 serine/threonine protein kinase [Plasmodium gonderi]
MQEILKHHEKVVLLEKREKDGESFVNDYRVVRTVKEGKFSKVILCEKDGKFYGIKKYEKKVLEKQREFYKSNKCAPVIIRSKYDDIKKELEILADIKNEYCLSCDEIITNYNEIYIVNNYMENESILQYDGTFFVVHKNEHTFIALPVIKCIVKSVLKSLVYIHTIKNICHRDVKPSNIFLSKSGIIKLGDFGESQYMMTNREIHGTKGTYEFMPPEFFTNESCYYGEKVDIWGLGICLYALFYRVLPFTQRKSLIQLFQDIGRGQVQYHLNRNNFLYEYTKKKFPSCDRSLSNMDIEFLSYLLRKNPRDRFSSEEALEHEWLKDVNYTYIQQYAEEIYKKKKEL